MTEKTSAKKLKKSKDPGVPKSQALPKKKLNIRESLRKLPEKKPHLDFIAAILTIPLLALTLYLNLSNLRNKTTPSPTPAPTQIPLVRQPELTNVTPRVITITPQPTADTNTCIKEIGPIDISYPNEGQVVSDNPLCVQIDYQEGNYCSVVWSYKINSSNWSDYSNNSVCLYNLPNGNNTFQLQIKSLVSPSTKTITRHFLYSGGISPTPTISTITPTTGQIVTP